MSFDCEFYLLCFNLIFHIQALETKALLPVQTLVKPDAEKYFNERPGSSELSGTKFPALAECESQY